MYQIEKEMFGASELHQYLPGLLPLYLEFAPACRYAGNATLSSETQSLRRVVNEDAMRNMLISEKRTEGNVNPSCQTHSRTELSGHKFLTIPETNKPLKVLLKYALTGNSVLRKNSIETGLCGV